MSAVKLEELGCGHNPKAPRFDIYPAGPNSPGGLHFGINGAKPSNYLRRMMPNWEEPHVHMDLVTFDSTVTAGNQISSTRAILMSLKRPGGGEDGRALRRPGRSLGGLPGLVSYRSERGASPPPLAGEG